MLKVVVVGRPPIGLQTAGVPMHARMMKLPEKLSATSNGPLPARIGPASTGGLPAGRLNENVSVLRAGDVVGLVALETLPSRRYVEVSAAGPTLKMTSV